MGANSGQFNHPVQYQPFVPLEEEHRVVTVIIKHRDMDILGLPGWIYDDGRVELWCDDGAVLLPAPAAEILRDIRARRCV